VRQRQGAATSGALISAANATERASEAVIE
jgi:hypothetical protein